MKKKILALFVGFCAMAVLCGCGRISNDKITIKRYKGLKVEVAKSQKVTDKDVNSKINSEILALGTKVAIRNRAAEKGDVVYIDYVGTVDGVEFYGGSADDYVLELGSDSFFIDRFEKGIIGRKPGETFVLNLKFPETYKANPSLAEKPVVFQVTFEGIVPGLTEGLVKKLSEKAETIEEYKKEIRKELEASKKDEAQADLEKKVWQKLVQNCEVKEYPKDKIKEYTEQYQSQYEAYAATYAMTVGEVIKQEYGVSLEQLVKDKICSELAMELIVEKEEIVVTAKDYEQELKKLAAKYNYDDPKAFEEFVGEANLKQTLLQEKVTEFLINNCKQVEGE